MTRSSATAKRSAAWIAIVSGSGRLFATVLGRPAAGSLGAGAGASCTTAVATGHPAAGTVAPDAYEPVTGRKVWRSPTTVWVVAKAWSLPPVAKTKPPLAGSWNVRMSDGALPLALVQVLRAGCLGG